MRAQTRRAYRSRQPGVEVAPDLTVCPRGAWRNPRGRDHDRDHDRDESALFPAAPGARSGQRASLVPRAGVEWEPWARAVRLRGGELPRAVALGRGAARPRLLRRRGAGAVLALGLQVSLAADLARAYTNASVSNAFWSDLGPGRVPAAAALRAGAR